MTKPKDREPRIKDASGVQIVYGDCVALARRVMRCATCGWAIRKGDECAEQEFVLGCIHWKERE